MTQKFYLHDAAPPDSPTAGEKSTSLPAGTPNIQALVEGLMNGTIGVGQVQKSYNTLAQTADQDAYLGRFSSVGLQAGTYGSGNWTWECGCTEGNNAANAFFNLAIYFWRPSNNTKVGTVYDSHTDVGGEWPTAQNVRGGTFAGSNVTIQDGDILVIEVWQHGVQSMAVSYGNSFSYDGATEGSSSDTASFLTAPADIPEVATVTEITWLDTLIGTDQWIPTKPKTFIDTLTGLDEWLVAKAKTFEDLFTNSDLWTLERSKQFLDSFTGSDFWQLEKFKTWLESFSNTDEQIISKAKSFLDDLVGTDSWITEKSKQFTDALSFAEQWFKTGDESPPPPIPPPAMSTSGLSRRPIQTLTEKTVILQVKGKISSTKKLPISGTISTWITFNLTTRFMSFLQFPISGVVSSVESIQMIGKISISSHIRISARLASIATIPMHGVIVFSREKIQKIKKIMDVINFMDATDSIDEIQLETVSFTFNEVGAAGPFGSEDGNREEEFDEPSSFVGRVTYTPELQSLEIILNGFIYHYCGVPQRIYDSFSGANSKGVFYNREIKGQYLC